MKSHLSFPSISGNDRILISGATGWLGQELIARLQDQRPEVDLLPVASQSRRFTAGRFSLHAHKWESDLVAQWKPTVMVHLAYLTRELERTLGTDEYRARNQHLTSLAAEVYSVGSLRAVVAASSGAAVLLRDETYGRLKAKDEVKFSSMGASSGVATVIARVWSVSGALCPKPKLFALYELIRQTLQGPVVRIRADHEVRRRYVDAGEFLEIALSSASLGFSGVIDSGGDEVEIGELAEHIQAVLGLQRRVERPALVTGPDNYLSHSALMENQASSLGISVSDLATQIRKSIGATMNQPVS